MADGQPEMIPMPGNPPQGGPAPELTRQLSPDEERSVLLNFMGNMYGEAKKMDNNIHIRDKIFPIFSSPIRLNGKAIGSITIERMNHYKFENSESLKLEKLSIALGKAFEWSNDFKLIENAANWLARNVIKNKTKFN